MLYSIDRDNDFIGIFIQEAMWVFETIDKRLPVWRKLPTDRSSLNEIRRGFHTLKGSGRMVNALDLAEVAWKVENLLNRVVEGNVQATVPVVELVSAARDLMPGMLDAFKSHRSMGSDTEVEALMAQADALADDQVPVPAPAPARPTVAAPTPEGMQSPAQELVAINGRLDHIQMRSDEALHRSEMALQHARRIGAHIGALKEAARDRAGRAEMDAVIEQVNLLASEIRDLRPDTKSPQPEQPAQRRELKQLIDQLVRERMAPIQRRRSDLTWQLDEARRAADAAHTLAQWALTLSALVGIGAVATLTI